jgi:ParB family chromosome partitioning protein
LELQSSVTATPVAGNAPVSKDRLRRQQNATKAMVSSKSNEWYTPLPYIEAVRLVLGKIDLDPASCALANTIVQADQFHSEADDGLAQPWSGHVYLNPPYAKLGPKFVEKLIAEYESGNVTEAILLVNSHCTDSKWFKPLFNYVLCFTDHRSKFWNQDGIGGAPTHGSIFVYFGPNPEKFEEHFEQFGAVVQKRTRRINTLQVAA